MKVATAEEMRAIDERTIRDFGVPSLVLMERAALAVAQAIRERFRDTPVVVLAGAGNNGGDGLAAARLLMKERPVRVFMPLRGAKPSPDCAHQLEVARKFGLKVLRKAPTLQELQGSVVVDALLGTGLRKPLEGALARLIDLLNASDCPVVAVDIPSGVNASTAQVMGVAVRATLTVTFGLPKVGHLLHPGASFSGELLVRDIGFPEELLQGPRVELLEQAQMAALVPQRPSWSHKGTYGHVLVVAGSRGKTGAALLCARAGLRAGAGLVTLAVPEGLLGVFQAQVRDEMTLPLPQAEGTVSSEAVLPVLEFLRQRADVLAIGPGLGVSPHTETLLKELVALSEAPMVIDADGLNSLKEHAKLLRSAKAPVVLTPHPGEAARLLGTTVADIEARRLEASRELAGLTASVVVLKGAPTVVAVPEGEAFINPTGTAALAKAGTGDVLTGAIAGLMAQGLDPLQASLLGVFVHGLAGRRLKERTGPHGLLASELAEEIAPALKALQC